MHRCGSLRWPFYQPPCWHVAKIFSSPRIQPPPAIYHHFSKQLVNLPYLYFFLVAFFSHRLSFSPGVGWCHCSFAPYYTHLSGGTQSRAGAETCPVQRPSHLTLLPGHAITRRSVQPPIVARSASPVYSFALSLFFSFLGVSLCCAARLSLSRMIFIPSPASALLHPSPSSSRRSRHAPSALASRLGLFL